MNETNYINAMNNLRISEDFNVKTARLMKEALTVKKYPNISHMQKLAFSFASFAVIAIIGAAAWKGFPQSPVPKGGPAILATTQNPDKEEAKSTEQNTTMTAESAPGSITIPTIDLPTNTNSKVKADMMGLFVYKGRVYVQSNSAFQTNDKFQVNKKDALAIRGTYLGKTTGSINEWSKQEDYTKEFASTIGESKVYTVKGYDSQYRLMVYNEYPDGVDATIYDSFGGLTMSSGADYFDQLKLKDQVVSMEWQSFEHWNNGISTKGSLKITSSFNKFMDALYSSTPVGEKTDFFTDYTGNDNQKFIYLKTKDHLITCLRLFKDGYVYVPTAGFFQMDQTVFQTFWNSIGSSTSDNEKDKNFGLAFSPVSVTLKPDHFTVGTAKIYIIMKNNSSEELWYGMDYKMEQKKAGKWKAVDAVNKLAFIEIAKSLAPNSQSKFEVDLSQIKPALKPGKYRIIKTLNKQEYYVMFTLTK